jgi:hypothetical protein
MLTLHKITDTDIKKAVREKFQRHHYTPERWSKGARLFVATEMFDGKELIVGASAAKSSPSGTTRGAWCSHKVVVLPLGMHTGVWNSTEKFLLPDFDRTEMWRAIADAQAALFVNSGHPYYCNASSAPADLIAYRNNPASGWVPTSKNGNPPKDKGHGAKYGNKSRATNAAGLVVSHWYVGPPS